MKKLITILILFFLFTSCWDGEINGRKYKLHTPCIKSHTESYVTNILIGKSMFPQVHTETICDCYGKTDTIWKTINK